MDWREQGILLTVRPHGESAVIADLFTRGHGRHTGVVRGGVSRRLQPVLQPGAQIEATWRARLDEHIGAFTVEPVKSRSSILSDRLALAALNAACALLHFALPERDPHPALYDETATLFDALATGAGWLALYLHWELLLLDELGYGLDLTACAVTGATDDLAYVSPRSGRAVSRAAAGGWADRLLALPACLRGAPGSAADFAQALGTTGFFLEHRLAADLGGRPLPEARRCLAEMISRLA